MRIERNTLTYDTVSMNGGDNTLQSKETSETVKQIGPKNETTQEIVDNIKSNPEYKPNIAEKTVIDMIEKANKKLQGASTEFSFSIHEKTKEIVVKVLNRDTKEVIREIPSEKMLDMVSKLWEAAGIIVDEKR